MANGKFDELAVGGEPARVYASGAGTTPWAVVFHPWWGLNDDVIAYADRLAGVGFSVVAPDLVRGRVASTVEEAERLASEKDDDHADAVALAVIDRLTTSGSVARIGTVGFSMGAAWAIGCAAISAGEPGSAREGSRLVARPGQREPASTPRSEFRALLR